ncbi:hypothetical protein Tco_1562138 [Tanacetum coccineum]
MSSPNRSTSDIEDAFSSMNILNYTSVSSDYFPASLGSNSFNSPENSTDNMIPPLFSSFYNNTYLKDVQEFHVKELSISPPDPITPPAILTSSPILPPSLLFDPRYFFVPEELLPPKKQIYSPSSSSTTLSNLSKTICLPKGRQHPKPSHNFGMPSALTADFTASHWKHNCSPMASLVFLLGNDLKPYVRRFQELTTLCPNMVPNNDKLLEAFIGGLPRSIEGNVTASKPQTLEGAINIS